MDHALKRTVRRRGFRATAPEIGQTSPLPGIVLVVAIAAGARVFSRFTGVLPDVVIALLTGMVLRNVLRLPEAIGPGIAFTMRYLLRAAIILFGAGLTFAAIVEAGAATLVLVGACFVAAMVLGFGLARAFALPGVVGTVPDFIDIRCADPNQR
jgi:uncharacterized membrane protein YadS